MNAFAVQSNYIRKGYDAGDRQWFCIRTKPKCEELASFNLAMKDILVFSPRIEEFIKRSKRVAPLFPGYIFANVSIATEYYKVVWTTGVKQIVGYGQRPTPIEERIIYLIMDRIEDGNYIKPKFVPGDKVRIKDGAFSELIGIFETYCSGNERVKVLLELFNQCIEVELDPTNIDKIRVVGV